MKTAKRRLSPRIVTLLRKTRKSILADPSLYDQDAPSIPRRSCDTPGCICGWILYHAKNRGDEAVFDPANALLGGDVITNRLYALCNWTKPFRVAFKKADTDEARAKVAAKRITHFIKTDGRY